MHPAVLAAARFILHRCHLWYAVSAGAASLRANSSDAFPTPFLAEALPGTPSELGSDSVSTQASSQKDRAPAAPEEAAPNAALAPAPAPLTKEPIRVHVPAEAAAVDPADDKGKKISHKRGRSLSSLVPRLIGRRASATGDELHVSRAVQRPSPSADAFEQDASM